jgi:hypothetical protein
MTQDNGSLMIKPAVKNENAADLPLQIETFRLPRLFPDDFFFSLIWCRYCGCRIPSDEIFAEKY